MKFIIGTAALAAGAALAIAGCGGAGTSGNGSGNGSGSAPGTTSAGGTGTGTSTGTGTTTGTSGSGTSIDVCSAMPAATASKITGTTLTKVKPGSVEDVIFSCDYTGPNGALLQVSVAITAGRSAFSADVTALKAVGHPPRMVSGVGDEAFSEPDPNGNAGAVGAAGFASYGAVFGDSYIKIGGLTYVTASQGKQIAELLHAKA